MGNKVQLRAKLRGVLAWSVDSDLLPEDGEAVTIYTSGRFLWSAVRAANLGFVFDPVAISTLRSKGITLEPLFSGAGNRWVGRP
jgi:hypothetical protein